MSERDINEFILSSETFLTTCHVVQLKTVATLAKNNTGKTFFFFTKMSAPEKHG